MRKCLVDGGKGLWNSSIRRNCVQSVGLRMNQRSVRADETVTGRYGGCVRWRWIVEIVPDALWKDSVYVAGV